jgi:hypothetical protein
MFNCKVYLHLSNLEEYPDIEIASYNFDPVLQIGDKVYVKDLKWQKIQDNFYVLAAKSFSFEAMVIIRQYIIEPKRPTKDSLFYLEIGLEMADKEKLQELAEIIKENSRSNSTD